MDQQPIATTWLSRTVPTSHQGVFPSVVIVMTSSGQKGSGWLVNPTTIVTNAHVTQGSALSDIEVGFPDGQHARPVAGRCSPVLDLAAFIFERPFSVTPLRISRTEPLLGTQVCTWGHPLGYNGPAPILTMGHLGGVRAEQNGAPIQKRLVVNAALNPGNSGGPLLTWDDGTVCGVVVAKHAPMPPWIQSAIDALTNQGGGVMYKSTDAAGNVQNRSEAQVVAEVLKYFQSMTQVVLGEAIAVEHLMDFLKEHKLAWTE